MHAVGRFERDLWLTRRLPGHDQPQGKAGRNGARQTLATSELVARSANIPAELLLTIANAEAGIQKTT